MNLVRMLRFALPLVVFVLVGFIDGMWLPAWMDRRRRKKALLAKDRVVEEPDQVAPW